VLRGLRIGLYSTAAVAAITSSFSVATHGQFLRHLFVYNLNPMYLRQWFRYGRINLEASAPLAVLAFMPVFSAVTTLAGAGSWSNVRQVLKRQLAESDRSRLVVVASLHMLLALATTASAAKMQASSYRRNRPSSRFLRERVCGMSGPFSNSFATDDSALFWRAPILAALVTRFSIALECARQLRRSTSSCFESDRMSFICPGS